MLDWLVNGLVLLLALVFALAGACALFLGVFEKVTVELVALAIALLLAAGGLLLYLGRRWKAGK